MFKFQKLDVWIKAINFCDRVLDIAENLPKAYQFSLGDQIKRAAISVPANIAEASGRRTLRESSNFFSLAKGSVYEVVSLLTIASKRKILPLKFPREDVYREADEISKMLSGLIRRR